MVIAGEWIRRDDGIIRPFISPNSTLHLFKTSQFGRKSLFGKAGFPKTLVV